MNIDSGIFLGNRNQIAVFRNDDLWLGDEDYGRRVIFVDARRARFLAASPWGEYIAFWADSGESFRLIDMAGNQLWSCWMNMDKATPHAVRFSTSGDAVACAYDFEGAHGLFFCDIERRYTTTFGCSNRPIGHDSDLRYFVIDRCDPCEDESLAFYERRADSGSIVKIPAEVVSRIIEEAPLIVDRYRCIHPSPMVPVRDWDGLAISGVLEGFVVLKERSLHWFAGDSDEPEATINDCIPQVARYEWYRCALSVCGDNALIQSISAGKSIVVNRKRGVVWRGDDLSSTMLIGRRVLAQYKDGIVEVVRSDGSSEIRYAPPFGFDTAAADIVDDVLKIASQSALTRNVRFKTFELADK